MSSSLKPCPEGRLAHLDLSDRVNTLYICLVEDRGAEKDALRRSIAEEVAQRRLGIDAIGLSPDGVVELLSDFLHMLCFTCYLTSELVHPLYVAFEGRLG